MQGQKSLVWCLEYQFVPNDQVFQAPFRVFWCSHIPTRLTWTGQKTASMKSLASFPLLCWLSWYPQEEKPALFLSLLCIGSTLVLPNLGSGRPKEAPCLTEQLGMDLGGPYLGGGQQVIFVGKHSRVASVITVVNSFISQIQQCVGRIFPVGRAMNTEQHIPQLASLLHTYSINC